MKQYRTRYQIYKMKRTGEQVFGFYGLAPVYHSTTPGLTEKIKGVTRFLSLLHPLDYLARALTSE
jgi:hypothetical protein